MKFKGALIVAQHSWKYVYNSILNFANQEVEYAYNIAVEAHVALNLDENLTYETFMEHKLYNKFHDNLIRNALFKKGSNKIYKPKKGAFKKFTNRSTMIDLSEVVILTDKAINRIDFTTIDLDYDFNESFNEFSFIGQFINMVQTIEWPKRTGPVVAKRGCVIVCTKPDGETVNFLTAGVNPPELNYDISIVSSEPSFLSSTSLQAISLFYQQEHEQEIITVDSEFY